jgi:hypothetical protein
MRRNIPENLNLQNNILFFYVRNIQLDSLCILFWNGISFFGFEGEKCFNQMVNTGSDTKSVNFVQ